MRFGSILVLLACAAGVSPVRARPIPEPTRGKAPVDSSAERTQRKFSWNEASRPSRHTSNSLRPLVRDAIDRWLDEAPQNLNLSNRKVFDQIKKVEIDDKTGYKKRGSYGKYYNVKFSTGDRPPRHLDAVTGQMVEHLGRVGKVHMMVDEQPTVSHHGQLLNSAPVRLSLDPQQTKGWNAPEATQKQREMFRRNAAAHRERKKQFLNPSTKSSDEQDWWTVSRSHEGDQEHAGSSHDRSQQQLSTPNAGPSKQRTGQSKAHRVFSPAQSASFPLQSSSSSMSKQLAEGESYSHDPHHSGQMISGDPAQEEARRETPPLKWAWTQPRTGQNTVTRIPSPLHDVPSSLLFSPHGPPTNAVGNGARRMHTQHSEDTVAQSGAQMDRGDAAGNVQTGATHPSNSLMGLPVGWRQKDERSHYYIGAAPHQASKASSNSGGSAPASISSTHSVSNSTPLQHRQREEIFAHHPEPWQESASSARSGSSVST